MSTLTVTAKGQVTLRKELLEHLGVAPGQKIVVDKLPDGSLKVQASPKRRISEFFGSIKPKGGKRLTIEEIKTITEEAWAGKR